MNELLMPILNSGSKSPSDLYFANTILLMQGTSTANGAQNITFDDASSVNHTMTRSGDTYTGTVSPFAKEEGKWSTYFDGTNDRITVGSSSTLALGAGDYTLEFWGYWPEYPSSSKIIMDWRSAGATPSLIPVLYMSNTGIIRFDQTATVDFLIANTAVNKNQWYHIAIVRNGTACNMYFDGTSVASNTSSSTLGIQNLTINDPQGTAYTKLYMSNLRIVKGTAVYTGAFTPPTAPLTAITNTTLLTCRDNIIKDNSTNAWALTLTGGVLTTAFSPFKHASSWSADIHGGSYHFDGTGDYISLPTNVFSSVGDFTIEAWFYARSYRTVQNLYYNYILGGGTSQSATYLLMGVVWNGTVACQIRTAGGSTYTAQSSTAIGLNQWYHIAMSRSGSSFKAFLNGVQIGTTQTFSDSLTVTTTSYIGTSGWFPNNEMWDGYISDLRYVKGSALYTANFTPPTAPLQAISGCELLARGTEAPIYDGAKLSNFNTIGNTQTRTNVVKNGSSSVYFDGTGDYIQMVASPDLLLNSVDFTVEGWFYMTRTPTSGTLGTAQAIAVQGVGAYGNNNNDHNWIFLIDNTGLIFGKLPTYYTVAFSPTLNTWYHIAFVGTSSGSTITCYVDGVSQGAQTSRTALGTSLVYTTRLGIGQYGNAGGVANYYQGYMDGFRITKGTARYTSNFTPPGRLPGK